jgi:hypothetical protein
MSKSYEKNTNNNTKTETEEGEITFENNNSPEKLNVIYHLLNFNLILIISILGKPIKFIFYKF